MTQPSVLITGCSSGIGRALADAFQQAGYQVWASARKAADVEALNTAGFHAVELDVNDGLALGRLAERLKAEIGGLDVLINNAGYGAMGPLLDGGVEAMRKQFETNVFSLIGVTRACFPLLRQNKGLVVNIGSVSGVLVTPFAGAYCASKAAVHSYCESLRLELRGTGIKVVTIAPGYIDTPMTRNNRFPMPFLMPAERFAAHAANVIARGAGYRVLPWQMGLVAKLLRLLPNALFDLAFARAPTKRRQGEA